MFRRNNNLNLNLVKWKNKLLTCEPKTRAYFTLQRENSVELFSLSEGLTRTLVGKNYLVFTCNAFPSLSWVSFHVTLHSVVAVFQFSHIFNELYIPKRQSIEVHKQSNTNNQPTNGNKFSKIFTRLHRSWKTFPPNLRFQIFASQTIKISHYEFPQNALKQTAPRLHVYNMLMQWNYEVDHGEINRIFIIVDVASASKVHHFGHFSDELLNVDLCFAVHFDCIIPHELFLCSFFWSIFKF